MPVDQVEMLWRCGTSTCRTENKGRLKVCCGCGRPKTDKDVDYMPGDTSPEAAVHDPDLLRQAKAGPDWKCAFCGSSQRRLDGACHQCGAAQSDEVVDTPATFTAPREAPPARRTPRLQRPATPSPNIPRSQETWLDDEPVGFGRTDTKLYWIAGSVLLGLMGIGIWLLFRTKIVDAAVTSLRWEQDIVVERYAIRTHEGFDPQDGAFDLTNVEQRVHHYDRMKVGSHIDEKGEKYKCGEENCRVIKGECRKTKRECSSNKNGFATCTGGDVVCAADGKECDTKYCYNPKTVDDYDDVPQYRAWYHWRVWEWGPDRTVQHVGGLEAPSWPTDIEVGLNAKVTTGESERAHREAHYKIVFTSGSDTWTYEPRSEAEFMRFPKGTHRRLKVSVATGFEILP